MRCEVLALLGACSAAPSRQATVGNTAVGSDLDAPEWAAMRQGAVFQAHFSDMGRRVIEVVRVETTPTRRTIHLHWNGPFETVEITRSTVTFVEIHRVFPREPIPEDRDPGVGVRTLRRAGGEVCYIVPNPEACMDPCGTWEVCVDPVEGITGGWGWPSAE